MSLTHCYVLADDGKWYNYPVLSDDSHDWFICFDDDDPPELVVKSQYGTWADARGLLERIGISDIVPTITFHQGKHGRCFPPRGVYKAVSVWLTINKPIPAKLITDHDGQWTSRPTGEGVFYGFGSN